jgi:hypothetical protein
MNGGHPENPDNGQPENGQPLEARLARCAPAGAPAELRAAVLGQVRRELRAARWDRRLARVAAVLFAVGIGASGLVMRPYSSTSSGPASRPTPQTIGRLAATVAGATDLETARQFALQMAALQGWPAQGEEMEIIRNRFESPQTQSQSHGKDG